MKSRPAPDTSAEWQAIRRRLDVVIALMLRSQQDAEKPSVTDQVRQLRELGLDSPLIAEILGKPSNYVAAVIGRKHRGIRRVGKKPGKKRR